MHAAGIGLEAGRIPNKYVPKGLSPRDRKRQRSGIVRSRKAYKQGKYVSRSRVRSFRSKESPHIRRAKKMYKVASITPSRALAKKTGCAQAGLRKIVKKGKGAFYSSGSRPNQTPSSWAYARLGSALTGKGASVVDFRILEKYCKPRSKPLLLARHAKQNKKQSQKKKKKRRKKKSKKL